MNSSTPSIPYKLVVLGSGGVGKSALTSQFIHSKFTEEYDPTIEDSFKKQCKIDNQETMLDILDTAGQEEYSAMREQYIRTGQGFLIVYSITSRTTFNEIENLYYTIQRVKDRTWVPCVVVGNKCDLKDERVVSFNDGHEMADQMGAKFIETSAKERINIDECFFSVVRAIRDENVFPTVVKKKKRCVLL